MIYILIKLTCIPINFCNSQADAQIFFKKEDCIFAMNNRKNEINYVKDNKIDCVIWDNDEMWKSK